MRTSKNYFNFRVFILLILFAILLGGATDCSKKDATLTATIDIPKVSDNLNAYVYQGGIINLKAVLVTGASYSWTLTDATTNVAFAPSKTTAIYGTLTFPEAGKKVKVILTLQKDGKSATDTRIINVVQEAPTGLYVGADPVAGSKDGYSTTYAFNEAFQCATMRYSSGYRFEFCETPSFSKELCHISSSLQNTSKIFVGPIERQFFNRGSLYFWRVACVDVFGNLSNYSIVKDFYYYMVDEKWLKASVGATHCLAIKDDGTLWGWGGNGNKQIEPSNTSNHPMPVQISSEKDWSEIVAGKWVSYAIKADGRLKVWGNTLSVTGWSVPFFNTIEGEFVGKNVTIGWKAVSTKDSHTLAIDKNGRLYEWGSIFNNQVVRKLVNARNNVNPIGAKSNWEKVFAGFDNSYAIDTDGALYAWGKNSDYQLGIGTTDHNFEPVLVDNTNKWVKVAVTPLAAFGLTDEGKVYGWGKSLSGECKFCDLESDAQPRPELIIKYDFDLRNIIDIATGSDAVVFALEDTGDLFV